jgi:hypothetical protein
MTMTPVATSPAFASEMRLQIDAAREAVTAAEAGDEPLLVDLAQGRLDGLLRIAHGNGLVDLT